MVGSLRWEIFVEEVSFKCGVEIKDNYSPEITIILYYNIVQWCFLDTTVSCYIYHQPSVSITI